MNHRVRPVGWQKDALTKPTIFLPFLNPPAGYMRNAV
jgi:hypothetical protein